MITCTIILALLSLLIATDRPEVNPPSPSPVKRPHLPLARASESPRPFSF